MSTHTETVTPEVGMGAVFRAGSDRYPATIIAVSPSGRQITVQQDKAHRLDSNGQSESQEYGFEPDPNGGVYKYSLRKNGHWHPVGTEMAWWNALTVGKRGAYLDPSF